ncbi:MAG: hypothetical protein FWC70_11680 [Defluviitaleaceae bacterium]|nr:hypothetical protein [Defluviitaleaceae bacterium]
MAYVIAIDGRAASGKTTLARQARFERRGHVLLATHALEAGSAVECRGHVSEAAHALEAECRGHVLEATHSLEAGSAVAHENENASVIHMDDFFLPENMRTPERLAEPGGNVHYERFAAEVLPFLKSGEAFSYGIFCCKAGEIRERREIAAGDVRIVEGAYSCHPIFGDYADLRIFCDVAPDEQLRRIKKRNGIRAAEIFAAKWIPLEEKYLSAFDIRARADVVREP